MGAIRRVPDVADCPFPFPCVSRHVPGHGRDPDLQRAAAGLNALALGAVELGSQVLRGRAPHFTERPTKVYRGDNPRRDSMRSNWWTPRLQRDLENAEFSRELDHEHGWAFPMMFTALQPSQLMGQYNTGTSQYSKILLLDHGGLGYGIRRKTRRRRKKAS